MDPSPKFYPCKLFVISKNLLAIENVLVDTVHPFRTFLEHPTKVVGMIHALTVTLKLAKKTFVFSISVGKMLSISQLGKTIFCRNTKKCIHSKLFLIDFYLFVEDLNEKVYSKFTMSQEQQVL